MRSNSNAIVATEYYWIGITNRGDITEPAPLLRGAQGWDINTEPGSFPYSGEEQFLYRSDTMVIRKSGDAILIFLKVERE